MKKLMMAAAIVCAAVAAHAAAIDWSVTGNTWTLQSGSKAASGFNGVYLINNAYKSAIVDAITQGKFTATTEGVLAQGTTTGTKGTVASSTATSDSLKAGTKYDFAVLILDNTTSDKYYAISGTASNSAYTPGEEAMAVAFGSTQFSGMTYTKVGGGGGGDVPEPTSALLLVLGVAGLALRRRHA